MTPEQKERRRQYTQKWHEKNPDRVREYKRKWAEKNPDKHRAYQRDYYKAWYEKNRERVNSAKRKAYAQDCVRQNAALNASRDYRIKLNSGHVTGAISDL